MDLTRFEPIQVHREDENIDALVQLNHPDPPFITPDTWNPYFINYTH